VFFEIYNQPEITTHMKTIQKVLNTTPMRENPFRMHRKRPTIPRINPHHGMMPVVVRNNNVMLSGISSTPGLALMYETLVTTPINGTKDIKVEMIPDLDSFFFILP